LKRGEIPDPKDDKWHSSEDEDQEKEERKSDPKPNEDPTTSTENPSEKPSTPENPSEKPITPENPTTEDNMTRLNKLFPPITPTSPEKEKETETTGKCLKKKKYRTTDEIIQALDSIEITPMKPTQKETEKKETEKDTQQEKETVKAKQQVKGKAKVPKSGPSTPAKKDRTDSVAAAKSPAKSKTSKVVGDLETNSLCVAVYIDKWFPGRVLDNTAVLKGYLKVNFANPKGKNSFDWKKDDILTTPIRNIIMTIKETDIVMKNNRETFGLTKEHLATVERRMKEITWTESLTPEDEEEIADK